VRFKVKKSYLILILIILIQTAIWLPAKSGGQEEKLLQEAKLLIFDKNWVEAEKKLDEFLRQFPKSNLLPQALFYRGKAQAEQKGKEKEALKTFQTFLSRPDKPQSLVEEAEIAIVDLAFALYSGGQEEFGPILVEKLSSQLKVVRYYAALKMSYLRDKKLAARALPVLKKIIEDEKDQELVDRAKIALLRISPEAVKDVKTGRSPEGMKLIKIRVYEKGKKMPSISLNLPLSLADLAIQAISEEDKARLREKGYDLNRILSDLARSKEKLVRIEEDGNIIEIWIE
jgi:tetratricopeptide (TPR) repeat protein